MAFTTSTPGSTAAPTAGNGSAFARSGSILAVDFGSVRTRAVLIDLVDGIYQLVATGEAPTTAGFPHNDVAVGLANAAEVISRTTQRVLLGEDHMTLITPEQPDRSGVDIVRFTASIGRPLRTVVIGLVPEMSAISAARATAGTYVQVVETITLADKRRPQDQLNAILLARPDLIFIVGGTEGGAKEPLLDLVTLVKLAIRYGKRSTNPPILYAGNGALIEDIQAAFADVTTVFIAENVRPSVDKEAFESAALELALAYDTVSASRGFGFDRVSRMSELGVLPTAQSYDVITEYLGRSLGGRRGTRSANVLIADLGSAVSTLSASIDGRVITSIRTDLGVGSSADSTYKQCGAEAVRMWLPFTAAASELEAYALNKTLRPAYVPGDRRSLYLEHGLVRAALRKLLNDSRPAWTPDTALDDPNAPLPHFQQIIGAGAAITQTGRPGMSAMLLLDALQPTGVTQLWLDAVALIPALGALAPTSPEAVVQVLDAGGIQLLGTAISLSGTPRMGRPAARIAITTRRTDGKSETARYTLNGGELGIYPISPGAQATISIRVMRRSMSINGKHTLRIEVVGGTAGVIIDARGRPVPVPVQLRARAAALTGWYAQATGDDPIEIPEEWLIEVKPEADIPSVSSGRRGRKGKARPEVDLDEGHIDSVLGPLDDDQPELPPDDKPAKAEKPSRKGRKRRGKNADAEEMPDFDSPFDDDSPALKPKEDEDDLRNLFS
ncbi:MAG: glutamate mutase L [Anaerolineae bacterium]